MITLQQLPSQGTFPVRQPVLRPGLPVESCIFDGDDLPTTVHYGIYDKGELAGVVSIFKAQNSLFANENQLQVRGMAVLDQHQKKGFGEKLMQQAEHYALQKNAPLIWFNAREIAVGFYKKMGYLVAGNPFDIPGVGIHYVMYKHLTY